METQDEKTSYIRDVWQENLESEVANIREMVVNFPCISMDTEFPGVVAKPVGSFKTNSDYHYQTLRCNVDLLKIIQANMAPQSDPRCSPAVRSRSSS
jgi:CCR4-NOT transcription complex subunit 7/8